MAGPGVPGLAAAELRQLGGALARPQPRSGALERLDGAFLALGLGFEGGPDDWARQRAATAQYLGALEPWATGGHYLLMNDHPTDTRKAFPPEVHTRLAAVRRCVDPAGLFLDPHPHAAGA